MGQLFLSYVAMGSKVDSPAELLNRAVLLYQQGLQGPHLVFPDCNVVLPLRNPVAYHIPHQDPDRVALIECQQKQPHS